MHYWLLASILYVLSVGAVGVSAKLALRHVEWPVLFLSTAVMYFVLTVSLLVTGRVRWPDSLGVWSVLLIPTGVFPALSFIFLVTALNVQDASKVVPITASYPLLTAILSMMFLGERFTAGRVLGTLLIVGGAILVAR